MLPSLTRQAPVAWTPSIRIQPALASANSVESNMYNQLQVSLTLLSLLTAVLQLNPAFYNGTTVYMRENQLLFKRTATISASSRTPACACLVFMLYAFLGVCVDTLVWTKDVSNVNVVVWMSPERVYLFLCVHIGRAPKCKNHRFSFLRLALIAIYCFCKKSTNFNVNSLQKDIYVYQQMYLLDILNI